MVIQAFSLNSSQVQADLLVLFFEKLLIFVTLLLNLMLQIWRPFWKQYFDQDWFYAEVISHFRCRSHSSKLPSSEQLKMSDIMLYKIAS